MSSSIAELFKRLTTGVYVVGVAHGEVRNAFTAAWVMQVSYEPLLLALSINPHHSSYELLKQGGAFSISMLKKGQLELAALMTGQPAPVNWPPRSGRRAAPGCPCCIKPWRGLDVGWSTNVRQAIMCWCWERRSTPGRSIPKLRPWFIAIPATWTVPLPFFPEISPADQGRAARAAPCGPPAAPSH